MKADYKNWIPKGMIYGFGAAAAGLAGVAVGIGLLGKNTASTITSAVLGAGALDCGSGALTIACAKRNPQGSMVGIDRWGPEYVAFCKELREQNAEGVGVSNVSFQKGYACTYKVFTNVGHGRLIANYTERFNFASR